MSVRWIAAAGAAATLVSLFVAAPAFAADPWTPQPPGAGWQHGQLVSELPACDDLSIPSYGGWDIRDFGSTAHTHNWAGYPRENHRPVALRLGEPCLRIASPASTDPVSNVLGIRYQTDVLPIGSSDLAGAGGSSPWQSAAFTLGTSTYTANGSTDPRPFWDTRLFCASSEWSRGGSGETIYVANTRALSQAYVQQPNTTGSLGTFSVFSTLGFNRTSAPTALTALNYSSTVCKYITRVDLTVCEHRWQDGLTDPVRTCKLATWWAGDFQLQQPYDDNSGPGTPFCALQPTWPGCAFIDPDIDPSSPDVCAGAIPFLWSGDWLDWSWVPAAFNHLGTLFAHYGRCMFVPLGGFDRTGAVSSAWTNSAAGEVASAASSAVESFQWENGCGVLGTGTGAMFGDVTIDTCTWSSWATPIRTVLGVGVLALGGWWIVGFVWRTAASVINRRVPDFADLRKGDES